MGSILPPLPLLFVAFRVVNILINNNNPSYTFTTAGTYIIKLTVIDSTGATDSYSRAIYVNAPASTSTPTPTQTTALTTTVTTLTLGELSIPGPLDVIKEFMHLFYSIFDPVNYVMTVNESWRRPILADAGTFRFLSRARLYLASTPILRAEGEMADLFLFRVLVCF